MGKELVMSYKQRQRKLRLGIGLEAEALISDFGPEAYWAARRRAQEASSDAMARDWNGVALAIARKTRRGPAWLLPTFFH